MLAELRACKSFKQFSWLLGYTPKTLSYILYRIPEDRKYTHFDIPKRGGGSRKICAPIGPLKDVQNRLRVVLTSCYEELQEKEKTGSMQALAHGFRRGKTIKSNAAKHVNHRYVFNADIEAFFDSINFGRLYGYFIKNSNFLLTPEVSRTIARICCYQNKLPQGAPTSPILSNYIGHIMDIRLVRIAKKYGCTYSRYADDLTFSTNQKAFPTAIGRPSRSIAGAWRPGAELEKEVQTSGFKINSSKVHMKIHTSKQTVTGLVVNRKVNIDLKYYRYTRAMCHRLFAQGTCFLPAYYVERDFKPTQGISKGSSFSILGILISIKWRKRQFPWVFLSIQQQVVDAAIPELQDISLDALEGRLNFIYNIKGHTTRISSSGKEHPSGITKLYTEFLFYRYMVAQERPVLVTEGATDNIYLRCAIAERFSKYPELADRENDKVVYKVKFLSESPRNQELLRVQAGTDNLKGFIYNYINTAKKFPGARLAAPVIVIVDNDKAGRSVVEATKRLHADNPVRPNLYHLGLNLYLLIIPRLIGTIDREIEDLFDQKVLDQHVDGKVFKRSNHPVDPDKEYGKSIFAHRVIREKQQNINFDNFDSIFDLLRECINYHTAPVAKAS